MIALHMLHITISIYVLGYLRRGMQNFRSMILHIWFPLDCREHQTREERYMVSTQILMVDMI